jgi:hypothetical protein
MDIKTLEYMEIRAIQGRKLVNKIRDLKVIVKDLENSISDKRGITITLSDSRGAYEREGTKISNSYSDECLSDKVALKIFKQYIIDGLNSEIVILEKELAEI